MKTLIIAIALMLIASTAHAGLCSWAGCRSESQYGYSHGQGI